MNLLLNQATLQKYFFHLTIFSILLFLLGCCLPSWSVSNVTPWNPAEFGYQNLVYGASSVVDIQRSVGRPADEFVDTAGTMYPIIQNMVYYDEAGSGSASVFVLENGLLAGLFYKSANNQYIDLTFLLTDNGDRRLNQGLNGGYQGFFPAMLTRSMFFQPMQYGY